MPVLALCVACPAIDACANARAGSQEGNDIVLVQEYAEGGDLYRLLYKNGGRCG